jgi:hypothetical protein
MHTNVHFLDGYASIDTPEKKLGTKEWDNLFTSMKEHFIMESV